MEGSVIISSMEDHSSPNVHSNSTRFSILPLKDLGEFPSLDATLSLIDMSLLVGANISGPSLEWVPLFIMEEFSFTPIVSRLGLYGHGEHKKIVPLDYSPLNSWTQGDLLKILQLCHSPSIGGFVSHSQLEFICDILDLVLRRGL